MWKDPIVEEVRAIREKLAAECGYDLHKMLERDREVLKHWQGKIARREELLKSKSPPEQPR